MNLLVTIPRQALFAAMFAVAILTAIGIAANFGVLLGNASPSVPRGLYLRSDPDRATYVTFCLGERHRTGEWYRYLCSPDDPGGIRVLKRIGERLEDAVIVEGDGPRPLDSRVLGPVRVDEIRGWWIPLLQLGARRNDD